MRLFRDFHISNADDAKSRKELRGDRSRETDINRIATQ